MFKFKLLRPYQIISKMNELCLKIDLTILVILEVRSEILSANYSFLCLIYNCSLLESRSPILGKLAYLLKKKKKCLLHKILEVFQNRFAVDKIRFAIWKVRRGTSFTDNSNISYHHTLYLRLHFELNRV